MSRNPTNQDVQLFDHLTEALRRGRRRIRPEFVPELVAWLLMHAHRYEKTYRKFSCITNHRNDPTVKGTVVYLRHAVQVIQILINALGDGFDKFEWREATEVVSRDMDIVFGVSLPDDLNPQGKVTVPTIGE